MTEQKRVLSNPFLFPLLPGRFVLSPKFNLNGYSQKPKSTSRSDAIKAQHPQMYKSWSYGNVITTPDGKSAWKSRRGFNRTFRGSLAMAIPSSRPTW